MTEVNNRTFSGSTNLESIVIPTGINKIDYGTFENIGNLVIEDLSLDNITFLGMGAFQGTKIRKVSKLGKLTELPNALFRNCAELECVVLSDSIISIKDSCFRSCISLNTLNFPSSLKTIRDWAFCQCTNLESIILPDTVEQIMIGAFRDCSSRKSITILAPNPPALGLQVFENTNNCPIYVPTNSVAAYKTATNWSAYASRIQAIPD